MVSVGAAFAFMGISALGVILRLPNHIMGLLELGVAAVFLWVFIQAFRMWRARQSERDG